MKRMIYVVFVLVCVVVTGCASTSEIERDYKARAAGLHALRDAKLNIYGRYFHSNDDWVWKYFSDFGTKEPHVSSTNLLAPTLRGKEESKCFKYRIDPFTCSVRRVTLDDVSEGFRNRKFLGLKNRSMVNDGASATRSKVRKVYGQLAILNKKVESVPKTLLPYLLPYLETRIGNDNTAEALLEKVTVLAAEPKEELLRIANDGYEEEMRKLSEERKIAEEKRKQALEKWKQEEPKRLEEARRKAEEKKRRDETNRKKAAEQRERDLELKKWSEIVVRDPNNIGIQVCKKGTLEYQVARGGRATTEYAFGYYHAFLEGHSPDSKRIKIRVRGYSKDGGGLRYITGTIPSLDGLQAAKGAIVWQNFNGWYPCG